MDILVVINQMLLNIFDTIVLGWKRMVLMYFR